MEQKEQLITEAFELDVSVEGLRPQIRLVIDPLTREIMGFDLLTKLE
ncbi:hypothetical protein O9H85_00240 [Paenibacillus filicis]|uniref:EAL domain-containing protein n=1 Tax=Paenibacillus gyeongsangnamensis TaxID=3388067 RepID=A0ABT4Q255_9BACL|nr:hypothetical protein [Paenibacillus filicis]MCZ8510891.1 hypothetical protein [Paenibacillus filicis]